MKAIAVHPGQAQLDPPPARSRSRASPTSPTAAASRSSVLRVGVDGTDKEINAAEYGAAPPGDDFLVTGHESFGQVVEVGPNVPTTIRPGHLRRRVRAPARLVDLRQDRAPGLHDRRRLLRARDQPAARVPDRVLRRGSPSTSSRCPRASPRSASCSSRRRSPRRASTTRYEIQRRLKVWEPRRACVLGSGTVGLLTALVARLRGLELTVYSLPQKPNRNADLIEQLGGVYVSSQDATLAEAARRARAVRPDRSTRPASARSSGRPPRCSARTACSCSRRSPAATARPRSTPTGSTRASCSATRSWSARSTPRRRLPERRRRPRSRPRRSSRAGSGSC